jgi:hypothetical protein
LHEFKKGGGKMLITTKKQLPLYGWHLWSHQGSNINAKCNRNEVTFNGDVVDAAGYVTDGINPEKRGKTLILEVINAHASFFINNMMFKVTYNKANKLLLPADKIATIIENDYLPVLEGSVDFQIPADFDGKMGIVFNRGRLRDLKIRVFIQG